MKKIMAILLVIMIVCLTGCSNSKNRVVIYTSMEEERNQELKKQLKEEFPDINVVVQYTIALLK